MTIFDAIILGILQGLTEFLPVSSSGHLVLTEAILGAKQSGVSFELTLHVASLLAVVIYFRQRLWLLIQSLFDSSMVKERKMILFLVIGTLPAVVAALLFKDFFEAAFSAPILTSSMLFVTGAILVATRFKKPGAAAVKALSALIMGIGQACAIMPGISRSGTSISAGMFAGVDPSEAAEFSFLMAIPAIIGAVVFKFKELAGVQTAMFPQYLAGFVATFIFSLLAVYLVLAVIRKGKFEYFGYYCFAAGALGLYLFL